MTDITMDDLQELIESILVITTENIIPKLSPEEDLVPCLFIGGSEKDILGIAQVELPDTHNGRSQVDQLIRQRLREMGASSYAFTMMGWMVELERNEDISNVPSPANHPRRVETFFITAGSEIAYLTKIYKVIRDKRQKIAALEDLTMPGTAEQFGLFVNMLGSRPESSTLH